jgi:hypothetical protein
MTTDELIKRYPILWHMAEDGAWPGIWQHGLLSTSALLDLHGITGDQRRQLESQRRPQSVILQRDGLPQAIVRDQKPMTDPALLQCLRDGLTPRDWYRTLNAKIFFWVCHTRLQKMLQARAYRGTPQIVLTVDTASLYQAHGERVLLSPINSGATLRRPQPRGHSTFRHPTDFPHDHILRQRRGRDPVVEFVVEQGVPDIFEHLLIAERMHAGQATIIWQRPTDI